MAPQLTRSPTYCGVMIESNLVEGNQRITQPDTMLYGQSVTDACIGWEDSELCLRDLASASGERIKQMMA